MAREDVLHKIEVHVAGLCFEKHKNVWRCLIGLRAHDRALYPDLWECGGGQVHAGESFEEALLRQMSEEFDIDVNILFPLSPYSIKTEEGLIPGIKFVCALRENQKVQCDGREIVKSAWITEADIEKYDFISGIKEDIHRGFMALERWDKEK